MQLLWDWWCDFSRVSFSFYWPSDSSHSHHCVCSAYKFRFIYYLHTEIINSCWLSNIRHCLCVAEPPAVKGLTHQPFQPSAWLMKTLWTLSSQSHLSWMYWLPHATAETDGLKQGEGQHIQSCFCSSYRPLWPRVFGLRFSPNSGCLLAGCSSSIWNILVFCIGLNRLNPMLWAISTLQLFWSNTWSIWDQVQMVNHAAWVARVSVPLGLLLVEGWVWDAYCMLLTCTAVLLHAVNMHSCLTASC